MRLYGTAKEKAEREGMEKWRGLVWNATERLVAEGLRVRTPQGTAWWSERMIYVETPEEERRYGYAVEVAVKWTDQGFRVTFDGDRHGEKFGWGLLAKMTVDLLVEKTLNARRLVLAARAREDEFKARERADAQRRKDAAADAETRLGFRMGRGTEFGSPTIHHPFEEISVHYSGDDLAFVVRLKGTLTAAQVLAIKAIVEAKGEGT